MQSSRAGVISRVTSMLVGVGLRVQGTVGAQRTLLSSFSPSACALLCGYAGLPSASASVPLLTPQHLLLQPQHVNGSRGEDGSLKLVKSSCVMFTPCTRKTVRSCKPKVIRKLQKRISKLLSDPPCVEGEPLGPIFQVGEVLGTGGQGCVASVRPVVLSVSSRGELEVASSGREDMVLKVYHGNRGLQEQELREAALSMLPLSKRKQLTGRAGGRARGRGWGSYSSQQCKRGTFVLLAASSHTYILLAA